MIPYKSFHTLLSIGSVEIKVWGFFVALGAILALILCYKEAIRLGLDARRWRAFVFITSISALIGTWLYYFIFVKGFSGGLFTAGQASFGFILGLIIGYVYLRKSGLSVGRYFDSIAIPMTVLIFFGRIGCYLVGDHLGTKTNVLWAIFYGEALRHPISLYYIVTAAVLFLVLSLLKNKKIFNGFLFVLFAVVYSFMRFVLGFLRVEQIIIFNLSEHQIAYFLNFCFFLVLLIIYLGKPKIKGASDILSQSRT
jgi:phosphatidylglycerol:prolipoprotein diacylglycerol transferase